MTNLKVVVNELIRKRKSRRMSFENLSSEWLEYKRNSVKKSTYYHYMSVIENHLNPNLTDLKFNKVINLNNLIAKLSQELQPKTVKDIITILKSILKYYEEEYYELNIKKCSLPKLPKKRIKILTKKEKEKLENYCMESSSLKDVGIFICLNTGMRIGEICDLKWKNIDLSERKIYIENTVERIYNKKERKTEIFESTPKTDSSKRAIPISQKLYDILKSFKSKYDDEDYFLSGERKFVEPRNYQRVFQSVLKKLKIKTYKFHILRHTFATNCLEAGMDTKSLSEILGHSDVNITLRIYAHPSDKVKRKYLEKI